MEQQLILIKTLNQLKQLEKYLEDKDFISIDCETTGVDRDAKVIGFSVCAETHLAYYVILSYWDPDNKRLVDLETAKGAKHTLSLLQGKALIAHNAPFDCRMLKSNFGVSLIESVHTDTLVLAHLLNENRPNGLKELGTSMYGDDAKHEQALMKASVSKNGGVLTKDLYELYKADSDLIGRYGAKDTILTLRLFYDLVPVLYAEGLDTFFYDDESMPLLRGPTYDMNEVGFRIDAERLQNLRASLEAEIALLKSEVYAEIYPHVKAKYPGTGKKDTFNIGAGQQLSWLLFHILKNDFGSLTDTGREMVKAMGLKPAYALKDKRDFVAFCNENIGRVWDATSKRPRKISEPYKYMSSDADNLALYSKKYAWVDKLLRYAKASKLLGTYVEGIANRTKYNIINPSFLQHGTTSGRYSCKNPNFQNLPRDDKRIKECVVSRPGRVFVGADYSQLEPRVFASVSGDETLLASFAKGEDFYSVVGAPIFGITGASLIKSDPDSFATKHPKLRNIAKAFALATPYGTSAFQQSQMLDLPKGECQDIIDRYFEAYPKVELMMLESHQMAKDNGVVHSLYGRPRRIPEAKNIAKIYGAFTEHGDLEYAQRTLLNLGMNHRVQSSGASIVNRAMIAFHKRAQELGIAQCWIVLQVHDEIVVECKESDSELVAALLKDCMEHTTLLPGIDLKADPVIAKNLKDLK